MIIRKRNNIRRAPLAKGCLLISLLLLWIQPCWGHGMGGTGLLHPLTGLDHLLAMLAVGAWSAQLGGRSIYIVPACFAGMMVLGGVAGIIYPIIPYLETAIAMSVLMLGLAVTIDQPTGWFIASFGVGIFGFCHGFAHVSEMNRTEGITEYILGFLITTVSLHLIGAFGGLLLVETSQGRRHLRQIGVVTSLIGVYLLMR